MTAPGPSHKSEPQKIEISDPIVFPAGLPGFESHRQFTLESRSELRPFLLLRSLDDSEIALPLIDCRLLRVSARPELTDEAAQLLGAENAKGVAPFFVLNMDAPSGLITANTSAPILITIGKSRGYQVFLDNDELKVDEPLMNLVPSGTRA